MKPLTGKVAVAPAWYRPYQNGVYTVGPGLHPFGKDFGNGKAEQQFFQIDSEFERYIANKRAMSEMHGEKVLARRNATPAAAVAALGFVADRLRAEHGEQALPYKSSSLPGLGAPVQEVFQALRDLSFVVQEDMVIVECPVDAQDRVTWLHVAAPNMWTPGEKVGESFAQVHGVVPGMASALDGGSKILRTVCAGQRYVRFVWGLVRDDRLTRLPGTRGELEFLDSLEDIFVRIERQVLVGLPGANALLFLIRTYLRSAATLPLEERYAIAAALGTMSSESRVYKGIGKAYQGLIDLLEG